MEGVFYSANVKTALKLAHVRGVALLAIAEAGMELAEYSPLEVKISVVGYGRAEKCQVQMMVRSLLRLPEADRVGRRLPTRWRWPSATPRMKPPAAGWHDRESQMKLDADSAFRRRALRRPTGRGCSIPSPFPEASPAYMQVTLDKTGNAEYRERPDDELPLKFKLTEAETQEVFDLAEKLDYFKHPLESPLKVAFMGTKTFRYENGAQKTEVKFNYSRGTARPAITRTGSSAWPNPPQHRIDLERAAKYDKLGVDKAIRLLELRHRPQAPGGPRSVPADARPHRQQRNLHAHGARPGRGDRRVHPRRCACGAIVATISRINYFQDPDLAVRSAQVDQRTAVTERALNVMLADLAAHAHFEVGGDRRITRRRRQARVHFSGRWSVIPLLLVWARTALCVFAGSVRSMPPLELCTRTAPSTFSSVA